MARIGKEFVLCLAGVLVLGVSAFSVLSITVTGTWTLVIDQSDLQGPPGSDLISIHESATNQVTLGISGATSRWDTWRIDIRKVDSSWHADLHLFIMRTNNGTSGTGAVLSGGTSYQEITGINTQFLTGRGNRGGITLREKIEGVSVQIPVASYTITIYYTVVDT